MIKELEEKVWEALKARNPKAFLALTDESTIMICGGYRCSAKEYAGFVGDFDCSSYTILHFEEIISTEDIVQVHYIVKTTVSSQENADLAGEFNVTSTWKKHGDSWKMVFNMDSRIG